MESYELEVMNHMKFISQNWPIVAAFITGLIWLVRLEGKVSSNAKLLDKQNEYNEMVSFLKTAVSEIKNDIKWMKNLFINQNKDA